jgi:Secretion system C-terminal sorting domain
MLIRNLGVVVCFLVAQSLWAQIPDLELTMRYSLPQARYEVYARPTASLNGFNWGPSQITVLTPASVPNMPLVVVSAAGGAWQDNSNVYAPTALPGFDFHGVGSLGAPTNLVVSVEKLIFHFTLPGGGCTPGLRLYINGIDPTSAGAGMNGGDFSNTVFAIVPSVPEGYESYIGNYENNGTVCVPLPLELVSFQATAQTASIDLLWQTENEKDLSHFDVERSDDGRHFTTIASLKKSESGSYQFPDHTAQPGITYYYRLKITDTDQAFAYSGQVSAALKGVGLTITRLAPNPTTGFLKLQMAANTESQAKISITDMTGRFLEQRSVDVFQGENNYIFDMRPYPPGVYLFCLENNNERLVKRIVRTD